MRRRASRHDAISSHKLKIPTFGLLWLASACWRIITLINVTWEEDVKKPVLFLLWLVGQIPGFVQSGVNMSLKGLERAGDELESLSWEGLWMAAIRVEQGIMQVTPTLFSVGHIFGGNSNLVFSSIELPF